MSRIKALFEKKTQRVLNVYCTAGYPELDSTMKVLESLQENGADLIELGMPYSDPLADGEVIQMSSSRALANGMTIPVLFDQLKELRKRVQVPVILMGYMNPVLQYGFEKFCRDAQNLGIDGLILPDLPEYEFEKEYGQLLHRYGLDFIFLVTPETSEARVRKLDALSSGFLYAVSSSSTTGAGKEMKTVSAYLQRLNSYGLKNPIMVGFGIGNKKTFDDACDYANGAIIGSAYIKAISDQRDIVSVTEAFLSGVLK